MIEEDKVYIEMCKKSDEIQKARPQKYSAIPDLFYRRIIAVFCPKCEKVSNGDYCSECGSKLREEEEWGISTCFYGPLTNAIWLPYQHQLQEMLGEFLDTLGIVYQEIWTEDYGMVLPKWSEECKSMEQFWLVFVMHEKYNKIWRNSQWELLK